MQASITSFFKPKQSSIQEHDQEPKREQTKANNNSDDESVCKTLGKRPAEDESDHTPGKRQALSSQGMTTPIKSEVKLSPSNGDMHKVNTSPLKTKLTVGDKVNTVMSPLVDLEVIIRQKINSGSSALHENIGPSWFRALRAEFDKPYFKKLSAFVQQERKTKTVFPPPEKVYSWTHHHDIKDTRVIILGQDPYHGPNQAHGLCFSVQKGIRIPPSLINIFKELENDIEGFKSPPHGELTGWSKQGVLLLNTCLTVNQGQAFSHQNKGWESFTDAVISWISKNSPKKVVFMFWGRPAQQKSKLVDKRHKILTAAHPSPLSAHNGFFNCGHFSKANAFLKEQNLPEINWKSL